MTDKPPFRSLTPHLVVAGAADAIAFYTRAFGARELRRLPGPDGRVMHAMLQVGDSLLMLNDEFPEMGGLGPLKIGGSAVTIHLFVPDCDATIAQAAAAGATVTMPAADMFWGDRYGQLVDPFGHKWSVATHQHDYTDEQIRQNMMKAMPPCE